MATISVKAAPGLRFPYELAPKKHITDQVVEVESSVYYRRAIAEGDLIQVKATTTPVENVAQDEPKAAEVTASAPAKNTKKASPHE